MGRGCAHVLLLTRVRFSYADFCLLLKNEAWGVTPRGLPGSPLDPLEGTAGHVDDAPGWAGHHSDQPLPDALEEARGAFLLGTFQDEQ